MRNFIFSLCICFVTFNCIAQQSKVDSLQKVIDKTTEDSTRLRLLLDIGAEVNFMNPQKVLANGPILIELADKLKDTIRLAESHYQID